MSMIGLPNVRPFREMVKMKCENFKKKNLPRAYIERNRKVKKDECMQRF